MTMILVPGCDLRITSVTASGGLGDSPASKRMTSAGVLDTSFIVCCKVSVCATTSRSFSSAKILAIPTRNIASESATITRVGTRFDSERSPCGDDKLDRNGGRSDSWRVRDEDKFSEALKVVLIDDDRNAASCWFL